MSLLMNIAIVVGVVILLAGLPVAAAFLYRCAYNRHLNKTLSDKGHKKWISPLWFGALVLALEIVAVIVFIIVSFSSNSADYDITNNGAAIYANNEFINQSYTVEANDSGVLHSYSYDGDTDTYFCEGEEYRCKLTLSGRMPNAAKDITFVVLTNDTQIDFSDAYLSIVSSNAADFFNKGKSVIVEMY